MYDPMLVQPMRDELVRIGFKELRSTSDVEGAMKTPGSTLVVINSVCGCAAGSARPGIAMSLQHAKVPENLFTVFAGQDREATDYFRTAYLQAMPPSSPSIAFFKDGELLGMVHRHQIEGRYPEAIAQMLNYAYDQFCGEVTSVAEEQN